MIEFIKLILSKISRDRKSLNVTSTPVNQTWVVIDDNSNYQKMTFKSEIEIIHSQNGSVNFGMWEYIYDANALLIDRNADKLLKHDFIKKGIFTIGLITLGIILLLTNGCKKTDNIPQIPTLTTSALSSINAHSGICGGNITSDGGSTIIDRGVCWSTEHTPTISDNKTTDGTGTGNFTSNINGLTSNTTYYIRAYATNDVGTGYGMTMSFTTLPSTILTFFNKVYTVIKLTCNGEAKNIPIGGSVTFYDVPGFSVTYTGSTIGTINDSTIGLLMIWNDTLTLFGGEANYDLSTSSDYFFLKIRNVGNSTLYDLYVNYGLASQTYNNVSFPWDTTSFPVYETGYFKALTNSNVRLSFTTVYSYVYHMTAIQGTLPFTLPFAENQAVTISFMPNAKCMTFETKSVTLTSGAIPKYAKSFN